MDVEQSLQERYAALFPTLNEARCRRWAAVEAVNVRPVSSIRDRPTGSAIGVASHLLL